MRLHFKEFFENLIHEGYIYIISTFSSFNFPLSPKIKISCSSLIIDIHVCLSCNLYIRQSPFNIFQLSVFLGLTSWGWVSLLIKEGSFCSRQNHQRDLQGVRMQKTAGGGVEGYSTPIIIFIKHNPYTILEEGLERL